MPQKFPILSLAEVRGNPKVSLKKDAKLGRIGQQMAAVRREKDLQPDVTPPPDWGALHPNDSQTLSTSSPSSSSPQESGSEKGNQQVKLLKRLGAAHPSSQEGLKMS